MILTKIRGGFYSVTSFVNTSNGETTENIK